MSTMSFRFSIDATKVRRAKTVLGTRTARETIDKALDLALAWEKAPVANLPVLPPKKQQRLHFLLDSANAGKLTSQQSQELERLIEEAQILTIRKARLLADALAK